MPTQGCNPIAIQSSLERMLHQAAIEVLRDEVVECMLPRLYGVVAKAGTKAMARMMNDLVHESSKQGVLLDCPGT